MLRVRSMGTDLQSQQENQVPESDRGPAAHPVIGTTPGSGERRQRQHPHPSNAVQQSETPQLQQSTSAGQQQPGAQSRPDRHRARKENVKDLILQKRDVSYVQLALDLKRSQIQKLEAYATRRAKTLRQAEETLDRDEAEFDSFLKRNDEEVQEAVQKADEQARIRQDKTVQVKQLSAQLATIKSDINKQEELLEECETYKAFLAELTPKEWLEDVYRGRREAKQARHDSWLTACAAVHQARVDAQTEVTTAKDAMANARSQQQYDAAKNRLAAGKVALQQAIDTQEPEEAPAPAEESVEPNYFTDPKLLGSELHKMEAANAAAAERLQASEAELEAFRRAAEDTRNELNITSAKLEAELTKLQAPERKMSKRMSIAPRRGSVQMREGPLAAMAANNTSKGRH